MIDAEPHPTTAPARRGALPHVAAAAVIGVVGAVVGGPLVAAALFGGLPSVLGALAVVTAVVSAATVVLDAVAGPRAGGRPWSVVRGIVLGVLGTAGTVAVALVAVGTGGFRGVPGPLWYAAAAVPFAAVAGLQWRGRVRLVTAGLLVVAAAVTVVPLGQDEVRADRTAAVLTEVGTTAHPWVTEVDGLTAVVPQTTGSGYVVSPHRGPDGAVAVHLVLVPDEAVPGGDPCAGLFHTPEGTVPITSCSRRDDGWMRVSAGAWQQLLRRVDGTWLGATAAPDVPEELLDQALDGARPMTDEEYEAWSDDVLPAPTGG